MQNAQQTFIVPQDPGGEGGWDRAADDLVEWLEFAHEFLLDRDLTPTLNDVLFVPGDRPFLLSASANLPGFAVSYAFETSSAARLERAKAAFTELADVLWEKFHGRVYLVKNVLRQTGDAGEDVWRRRGRVLPPQARARPAWNSAGRFSRSGPSASCSAQVVLTTRTEQFAR